MAHGSFLIGRSESFIFITTGQPRQLACFSSLQHHANYNDEADGHRSTLASEYLVGSKYDAERLRHEGLTPHINKKQIFSQLYFSEYWVYSYPLLCFSTCLLPESFLPEMRPTIWCYTHRNQHSDSAVFRLTSRGSAWSGYGEEYN